MTIGTEANKVRGDSRQWRRRTGLSKRGSLSARAPLLRYLRCPPPMRACTTRCCAPHACRACVGLGVVGFGSRLARLFFLCPRQRLCDTPRCELRGVCGACSCAFLRAARPAVPGACAAHRSDTPFVCLSPHSTLHRCVGALRLLSASHMWVALYLQRSFLTLLCDAGVKHCLQRGQQGWLQDQPAGWRCHNRGEGALTRAAEFLLLICLTLFCLRRTLASRWLAP